MYRFNIKNSIFEHVDNTRPFHKIDMFNETLNLWTHVVTGGNLGGLYRVWE